MEKWSPFWLYCFTFKGDNLCPLWLTEEYFRNWDQNFIFLKLHMHQSHPIWSDSYVLTINRIKSNKSCKSFQSEKCNVLGSSSVWINEVLYHMSYNFILAIKNLAFNQWTFTSVVLCSNPSQGNRHGTCSYSVPIWH